MQVPGGSPSPLTISSRTAPSWEPQGAPPAQQDLQPVLFSAVLSQQGQGKKRPSCAQFLRLRLQNPLVLPGGQGWGPRLLTSLVPLDCA